ncbi:MAG: PPC domain-containing protein [Chloroflexota bacterium]
MKYGRIISRIALITMLSLLAVLIPVTPARAAEGIELSPTSGEMGDSVRVLGTDFDPDEGLVWIYFSSDVAVVGDDIDTDVTHYEKQGFADIGAVGETDEGEIDKRFTVPTDLTDGDETVAVVGGKYYVYLAYSDVIVAKATFTVIAPEITLDPEEGPVGTEVDISGTNFGDREDLTIYYDSKEASIEAGDDRTDTSGEFDSLIVIPASAAGTHTIRVEDDGGAFAEADFTVEPAITMSPTSGIVNTSVTVSGNGFSRRGGITITMGNETVANGTADTTGNFNITFKVPANGPGTYSVEASDNEGNKAPKVNFTMEATANLVPTTGNVGTDITVSGTGFKIAGAISVKYDDTQVATTAADASGLFSANFKAPKSTHGEHTIIVSDGTTTKQFAFVMESTPPETPQPQLPMMATKVEQPVTFDWEPVTDPSGVTYTLQIAQGPSFTPLVLQKKDLTTTEYTLSTVEELPPTSKEAPYYWRIKATDGAGNESPWTSPGTFYTGGGSFGVSNIPTRAIVTIGGLLVIFLLVLGFWLGRRTAYY